MDKKQSDTLTSGAGIFIMPRSSRAWKGSEALWITVAGWSAAAERLLGHAWVMTTDRIAKPSEVIHYPLNANQQGTAEPRASWIPMVFKTLLKDIILWKHTRSFRNSRGEEPWENLQVKFVWQQHDLFAGPGRKLASRLGVPLITYVHAPVIWETSKWGVRRPAWGKILEDYSESASLREADIVACVSEDVAIKINQLGVAREKIMVSPMSIDPFLFNQNTKSASSLRDDLGLKNKTVIGWTGSFRSFHGLDLLLKVFYEVHARRNDTALVLIGDGLERKGLEVLTKQLMLENAVHFLGRKPFAEIPEYISIFDIAVVSASSAENFHYSPLKLREYLAAGKPTVAPNAGEIPFMFKNDNQLLLYEVGNIEDTAGKIIRLVDDTSMRASLGEEGRKEVMAQGTWDYELKKVLHKLNVQY